MSGATPVDRPAVEVMFLRTEDDPDQIRAGWARLEELVELRGRKFYGAFHPATREYHACVQVRVGDDASALGLESGTLAGGRYLRVRLQGEPPEVYDRIGPTFVELARSADPDPSRPSIEFYRRRDEIDLFLPVAEAPKLR